MALSGQLKRIAGPAYLGTAVADIYAPPASTIYTVIRRIHVANKTTTGSTFSLYVGATSGSAGGTELFGGHSVSGSLEFDYPCQLKMLSTDFLSGNANNASSLVITVEGDQVVV